MDKKDKKRENAKKEGTKKRIKRYRVRDKWAHKFQELGEYIDYFSDKKSK